MSNDKDETPNPKWKTRILWLVAFLAIVAVQWPMIKGIYYKSFASSETAPTSAVNWRADFAQAQKEAGNSNKPILLDFGASWCPPCQVMKHEVWTDAEVGAVANEKTIPYYADVDTPANHDLVGRYDIKQIPTVILIDAQGNVLKQSGFMSAGETKDFINVQAKGLVSE